MEVFSIIVPRNILFRGIYGGNGRCETVIIVFFINVMGSMVFHGGCCCLPTCGHARVPCKGVAACGVVIVALNHLPWCRGSVGDITIEVVCFQSACHCFSKRYGASVELGNLGSHFLVGQPQVSAIRPVMSIPTPASTTAICMDLLHLDFDTFI